MMDESFDAICITGIGRRRAIMVLPLLSL